MDTIAQHKTRPLQQNIDLSEASLRHVIEGYQDMRNLLQSQETNVMAKPETDALWFYVQQHAMSLVERKLDADEPTGDYEYFIAKYHESIQVKALRMFYYLLLICTRESRHMNDGLGRTQVYEKYPEIAKFHDEHVQDTSSDASIKAMLDHAPDVTLGDYAQFLVDAFTLPSYGGGFGGDAWADVARPLRDFVHGKISAEILMDTAFTLAHNNGPIFNKGMLYYNYSSSLTKILDVQRSGQIPQLIADGDQGLGNFVNQELLDYVDTFSRLDAGFGGKVDWTMVKNIHGSASYLQQIEKQKAASKKHSFIEKIEKQKAQLDADLKKKAAKVAKMNLLKGSIEILPGTYVAKGKRSVK